MTPVLDALRTHWQAVMGALVAILAIVLVARAWARTGTGASPEERRDRRGRLTEDLLTILVASIAAALSAHALTTYAAETLNLHGSWQLLPFGGLDAAAVVCAVRARRRARAGDSSGVNGLLVWVFAGISAAFSASATSGFWSVIGHGIWALVAATLWELGLIEQRRSRKARPDRSLGLIRWLHPVERIQVLAELATDVEITADEATARVRQRRAARALYRLNLADAEHRAGEAAVPGMRLRSAERRAQRAAARVRLADTEVEAAVMPQLRVLCEVRQIAASGGRPDTTPRQIAAAALTPATPPRGDGAPSANPVVMARRDFDGAPLPAPATGAALAPSSPSPVPATAPEPAPAFASAGTAVAERTATTAPRVPVAVQAGATGEGVLADGAVALDVMAAGVPRQAQPEEDGAGELDPRVLRLVDLLETDARLTGADAARELEVPVRTGQRLHRSARQLQQALQLLAQNPSATEEHLAQELNVAAREAARLHAAAVAELARRAANGHRRLRSVDRAAMPIG